MVKENSFRRRSLCRMLVLLAGFLVLPSMAAPVAGQRPSPQLSPTDVVRIQLTALRHNDQPTPDAGIATAYAFASSGNRNLTGSLQQFAQMIHAGYAPMIDSLKFILGKTRVSKGQAMVETTVIAANGRSYGYVFLLSRQTDPPYRNCWMTNSVLPQNGGQGSGTSV